jgi:1-acyl-sn-glycerol-3-phosphate acyltransferase
MLLTIPFLSFYYLVKVFVGNEKADTYAFFFTKIWAKSIILSTGAKVENIGWQNLEDAKNICFIANHQSFFDIPLLMGWLKRPVGFIAKKELKKIPILNGWITAIHSAFLDRSNPRKAIKSINLGIENIKSGHALAIFPEGTRSKDGQIAEFKTGSLKLAIGSNAVIQPITIKGTRQIYEETKHIQRSKVALIIHKPIYPNDDIYKDKYLLVKTLHDIIDFH